MDDLLKAAAVAVSLGILLIGIVTKRSTRSWTHPAVIFAVFWFLVTFIPLVAVWSVPASPAAILYILAIVAAFSAPALFQNWGDSAAAAQSRTSAPPPGGSTLLLLAFFSIQALTIACIFANLHMQGMAVQDILSDPIGAARIYLKRRYDGYITPNIFSQAGIILNYIAASIGGYLIVTQRSVLIQALILATSFIPSLLHMQLYADKGTLFLAAAYFYGAVIAVRVSRGDTALLTRKTLILVGAAFLVLIPALVATMLSRDGVKGIEMGNTAKVLFYLRSYAFSHVYAFSDWFDHYVFGQSVMTYTDPGRMTYGYWSFMAIGERVWPGYHLPDGYYGEYFAVPGVLQSNIYTMFRGAIYDFGLVGALVAFAAFGFISSWVYRRMLDYPSPIFSQSFFILLMGCIYSSFLFSLLTWASVYAAAVGVTILLTAEKYALRPLCDAWGNRSAATTLT